MLEIGNSNSSSICNDLDKAIINLNQQIYASSKNRALKVKYKKQYSDNKTDLEILSNLILNYRNIIKDIKNFQSNKKNKAIAGIYMSVSKANEIVTAGARIKPVLDNNQFWLEDSQGRRIFRIEGDGLQALASLFIRVPVIHNTEYMQLMILDECLATLNDSNSAEFSKYLPYISEDMQIIIIEQKPSVFENVTNLVSYRVWKEDDGVSYIEKENIQ